MTSQIYECSKCPKIDTKRNLTEHFIRSHVTNEEAPWRCSLCNFKALSRHQLLKHTNHFRHKEAVKRRPRGMVEYIESKTPYTVQFGRDILPHREDEPMYNIGMDKVIDYDHKSFGMVLIPGLGFDYSVGETESEEDEERRNRFCEREGNTGERRNRSQEREGDDGERRKKSEEKEGNGGERRRKSEEREGNGGERRRKAEEKEGNGGERRKKSEEREGNTMERRRKAEKREGNTMERRNISQEREGNTMERGKKSEEREGNGGERRNKSEKGERKTSGRRNNNGDEERNGEEKGRKSEERGNKRQRTSEPDNQNKKSKLTSSSDGGSRIRTKGDQPHGDMHQSVKRKRVPMATNDVDINEETNMKDLLEDKNVTGITKTYKEAQRAKTSFSLKTEELDQPLNNNLQPNKQIYDHTNEPTPDVEESAEVKVELGIADHMGVLVDKMSDLIQSLEPMKNISKALISLDFHMRRLLPLLEQCQNGRHSSTAGLLKGSNEC